MKKVYLAGPLGFSEAGRYFYYDRLVPSLKNAGFEVLDPWTLTDPSRLLAIQRMPDGPKKTASLVQLNEDTARNNIIAINSADVVVAVLDGTDVDSGTSAEIGFAYARGRPIIGYRGDSRLWADNHVAVINLQVEFFIRASGGAIVRSFDELPAVLHRVLTQHFDAPSATP